MAGAHGTSPTSVDEHAVTVDRMITSSYARAGVETLPLTDALGRVLADDVAATIDVPNFRNSQMDGYAVHSTTVAQVPVSLPVVGVLAAGDSDAPTLPEGSAHKIMTGAPIPDGADAVVPVEDTSLADGRVSITTSRRSGEFVREQGSDIRAGSVVVPGGTRLAPRHLGALAAVGVSRVEVRRRPRVAVIATGAELVESGLSLAPGQIYDSNGLTLAAAAVEDGADLTFRGRSTDSADEFAAILDDACAVADVVFTSGGVSMGDFEVVRDVLGPVGGVFGHVAMQPGGPQGLSERNGVPVVSFPGNPVSTLVSYVVFARPVLRRLAGLPVLPPTECTADEDLRSLPGKRQFLRGRRTATGVTVTSGPGSHLVASMAAADVLVDLGAGTTAIVAGDRVRVWDL